MSSPPARIPRFFARGVPPSLAYALVAGLALATWMPHLTASLWLDETLTYWVIKDGFFDALSRGVEFQSQPGYYAFLWLWTQVAGVSEAALRLPSLLAALGCCVAVAVLGMRLTGDREVGLLAMVVFASSALVFREAVDARPYMPGLLALCGVAIALIRWLDAGMWRHALCAGVLAAAVPQFHLFLVLGFPALGLYALLRFREAPVQLSQVGALIALLLVGASLAMPAVSTILAKGGDYSFAPPAEWSALFSIFVWPTAVSGLLVGTAISGWGAGLGLTNPPPGSSAAEAPLPAPTHFRASSPLLACWAFLPLLLLFAVSKWSSSSLFIPRYLVAVLPALSLVYGLALRQLAWPTARVVAICVIALASVATHQRPFDDFRGAIRATNEFVSSDSSVPVLFASGLVETQDEKWLRDPNAADYLAGATARYPVEGRLVLLPRRAQGARIMAERVAPVMQAGSRFAVVEWNGNGANVLSWIALRAERAGYAKPKTQEFGGVRVGFFSPAPANLPERVQRRRRSP